MLGPIPWLVETRGPDGGRGIALSSGTEVLSPLEQAEDVGVEQTGGWLEGVFSVSVLCLALTIPTGMEPETHSESARLERAERLS